MRFLFSQYTPFTLVLLSLLVLSWHSTPASALRLIVQPDTTVGAPTTVYWVREPTDPVPLFDLRFVVHGEGRDVGLAGANIDFTDNAEGAADGVRNVGRHVVRFPSSGRFVLVAVSGPRFQQIGTSNEVVVRAAPTITLSTTPTSTTRPTPTSTPSNTSPSSTPPRQNKTPVIVGAVVGSLLFLAGVALIVLLLLKRRRIRQEQDRLSFHPEQMVQRRRSRWISVSRFSISRGGGARAVEADRAEVMAEGAVVKGVVSASIRPQHDVEAQVGTQHPEEVVFDIDQHRKSVVSSIRTSLNSFSTDSASRSRYSGDIEAVQGAGVGIATIAGLLSVPSSTSLAIPPAPTSAPPTDPDALRSAVRALPAIPIGPSFTEDTLSTLDSRKSSVATTVSQTSELVVNVPTSAQPVPFVLRTPTTAAVPSTARTARPLPTPTPAPTAAAAPTQPPPRAPSPALPDTPAQPTTATLRALPPVPVTPASALPFPPTPRTATVVTFPTPTHYAPRTARQQVIDRRLSLVQAQLKLLRKKLARRQVDGEVGKRVEADLGKQVAWLERARECVWARDMESGEEMRPEGWSRYMIP